MQNPFKSRRVTQVPEPEAPSPEEQAWLTAGGWAPASDPAFDEDDGKTARRAGVTAALTLETQRIERLKEQRDRDLAGVERGHDFRGGR